MKNDFNQGISLSSDLYNDFITEEQMKRAYIHQLVRIEFPSHETNSQKISAQVNKITEAYKVLAEINDQRVVGIPLDFTKTNAEVARQHQNCREAVDEIVNLLAEDEVVIVNTLKQEAIYLGVIGLKKTRKKSAKRK